MRALMLFVAALAIAGLGNPARAHLIGLETYMGNGDLAYAGDVVFFNGEAVFSGRLHRGPRVQRVDYSMDGADRVLLVDDLAGQATVLTPESGTVRRLRFADAAIEPLAPQFQEHRQVVLTREAEEAVHGVPTVRYALRGVDRQGEPYAGSVWVAASGALIKAEIEWAGNPVRYDLYGYSPGEQDPSLFQLDLDQPEAAPDPAPQADTQAQPQTQGQGPAGPQPTPETSVMAEAQALLNMLGYNAGQIDGVFGGRTRDATLAFQRNNNLPRTGYPDGPTLTALRAQANTVARDRGLPQDQGGPCNGVETAVGCIGIGGGGITLNGNEVPIPRNLFGGCSGIEIGGVCLGN